MRVAKTVVKRKKDGANALRISSEKGGSEDPSGFCSGLPFRAMARPHPPTSRRIEIY